MIVIDMVYFGFVCLLKLVLYNNKPQHQMCDWNQKCFFLFFHKNLNSSFFYKTHTFESEVSLHSWLLWSTVGPPCQPYELTQHKQCYLFPLVHFAAYNLLYFLTMWAQYSNLLITLGISTTSSYGPKRKPLLFMLWNFFTDGVSCIFDHHIYV